MHRPFLPVTALLLGLSLCGCASSGDGSAGNTPAAPAPLRQGTLRDFSGHWEKDFRLSDDFNTRFQLYVADIRRAYGTQRNGLERGPAAGVNSDAINGLARFTEELTRMPLLDIAQNETEVNIERQDDFTLHCRYENRQFVRSSNSFGSDACGWEQEKLVFQLVLGGGLNISHQFTLSPDSSMLNVITRVSSAGVAVPLVISSYYQRFDPPEESYDCLLTLTRSTVCSQTQKAR